MVLHDPCHPVLPAFDTLVIDFSRDTWTPVELSALPVDLSYVSQQLPIVLLPCAERTITPRIIPAPGYLENLTHTSPLVLLQVAGAGQPLYAKQWELDLPATYHQPINAPGRPRALADRLKSHDALVGNIANEGWRWRKQHKYYLSCLRDVDRDIIPLLDELEALGLDSKTIIILTSDHGDLDGAHRLHSRVRSPTGNRTTFC